MEASQQIGVRGYLTGAAHLYMVSCRRLIFSRATLICALLLAFSCVVVLAWSMRRERSPREFVEQVFLVLHLTLLTPMYTLSYATAGVAAEREERTIVYLLVTPLPKPVIYLAKALASLTLALFWTIGGLGLMSLLAGSAGKSAFPVVAPAVAYLTTGYVCLFSLFGSLIRRATIVSLLYAIFFEVTVGLMPGIIKRIALVSYARCMIYAAGEPLGVRPQGPFEKALYEAVPGSEAQSMIFLMSGIFFLVGVAIFCIREYT